MSAPRCQHCDVPMYEKPGTRSGQGQYGYVAVYECKTVYCQTCKGKCRHIEKY